MATDPLDMLKGPRLAKFDRQVGGVVFEAETGTLAPGYQGGGQEFVDGLHNRAAAVRPKTKTPRKD